MRVLETAAGRRPGTNRGAASDGRPLSLRREEETADDCGRAKRRGTGTLPSRDLPGLRHMRLSEKTAGAGVDDEMVRRRREKPIADETAGLPLLRRRREGREDAAARVRRDRRSRNMQFFEKPAGPGVDESRSGDGATSVRCGRG